MLLQKLVWLSTIKFKVETLSIQYFLGRFLSVNFPTQTLPLKSNPCLKFATQILMFYFYDFATDLDPNRDLFVCF